MTPRVKREDQLQQMLMRQWTISGETTLLASSLWIAGGVLALAGGGGSDYHVCKVVEPARRLACLPACLTGAGS